MPVEDANMFVLSRVVCISFCSEKENFLSGSLDRTVLLWDQRAEKSQVKLMMLCDTS
jgi:WD40 repeat protein